MLAAEAEDAEEVAAEAEDAEEVAAEPLVTATSVTVRSVERAAGWATMAGMGGKTRSPCTFQILCI